MPPSKASTSVTSIFGKQRDKHRRLALNKLYVVWVELRKCEMQTLRSLLDFDCSEFEEMGELDQDIVMSLGLSEGCAKAIAEVRANLLGIMQHTAEAYDYDDWISLLAKCAAATQILRPPLAEVRQSDEPDQSPPE